tara:strand:+ start:1328 stop:1477 length:150 start_codon:yes stop_codon:yes gene_type:complete
LSNAVIEEGRQKIFQKEINGTGTRPSSTKGVITLLPLGARFYTERGITC